MSPYVSFFVGLAFMLAGSWLLPPLADWLGERWELPQGLLGIVVALAADSPEIASGVAALGSGSRDVGVGVILGSNVFNLAVLLGLSALVAGRVRISRHLLVLHGTVALLVTLMAAAIVTGTLAPFPGFMILLAVFISYLVVVAMKPGSLEHLPLPRSAARTLATYVGEAQREEASNARQRRSEERPPPQVSSWAPVALMTGALAGVVGGSTAMVHGALRIATNLGLPDTITGAVVIATLTGIPNLYTAVRLADRGRGRAVVSETLNSNTINTFVGIGLPALVVGIGGVSSKSVAELWWLLGMIVLALVIGGYRGRYTRGNAVTLIVAYFGFVAFLVL